MSCDPVCIVDVVEATEPAFVEVVVEASPAFVEVLVPGEPGQSAYAAWLSLGNVGSVEDFLISLRVTAALPTFPVAVTLSGHRAVRLAPDGLRFVDPAEIEHADTCFGITAGAATAGNAASVQSAGLMTEPGWSWSPGPVFVGVDGLLTQTLTRRAFEQRVGIAVGPTRLLIDIEPSFLTS